LNLDTTVNVSIQKTDNVLKLIENCLINLLNSSYKKKVTYMVSFGDDERL
jgi:hypothetical protein